MQISSYESHPITINNQRWDPLTSTSSASISIINKLTSATTDMLVDPYTSVRRSQSENVDAATTAGRAAAAGARGFGKFNMALFKGTIVDLPLAVAEGFRAVPKLYGEDVKSHGEVTGVASGFAVGGKNLVYGMADGVSDLWKRPYEDAKKEGAVGFVKGVGKGTLGFVSKTGSAAVGIVAYPGQGICKSIRYGVKSGTRKKVRVARLAEGEYLAGGMGWGEDLVKGVLGAFEILKEEMKAQ